MILRVLVSCAVAMVALMVSSSHAVEVELDLSQSSPALNWHSIENDAVRVIYPDELKYEAVYIANLVEHYSHVVGKTYGIVRPEKFNLIMRSEVAQPNGYVTLAPRRSEWFTASTFFPSVGATEWYQTLSIHEYRHVNQFDNFNRGGTKVLYYIMGDFGWQLASAFALTSWYFEGDAVWAETKYTDGGRGRSPRFMARLKALLLSNQTPTYDQLLSGSYRTDLPNHYVYGYALVSYAAQKYGEDVWGKISQNAARFPYPMRFYNAFGNITRQRFERFYEEAMQDLKAKWSKDGIVENENQEFREHFVPTKIGNSLYYVRETLDTHAELIRETQGTKEVLARIPYSRDFVGFEMKAGKAVYSEYLPHPRYMHKGTSDLFVIDLESGDRTRITSGQRYYSPSLNQEASKILATEFADDQSWRVVELSIDGHKLRNITVQDSKVAEVRYLDDQTAIAVLNSKTGYRSIVKLDLNAQTVQEVVLPESRNLMTSLYVDKNKATVFEAQYKGANEIFVLKGQDISRCTQSRLGSFTPTSDGENLYFSQMDSYGSSVGQMKLSDCKAIAKEQLVGFNYIGSGPSDAYNDFPPQPIPDQASLFTKNASKYAAEDYGDFDSRLVVPHTWGLMLGRGGGLGFRTDNYLRTLGVTALLGTDSEEGQLAGSLSFDIKKYYPIIRVQGESRGREVTYSGTSTRAKWTEQTAGLAVGVPYIRRSGVWNYTALLEGEGSFMDTSSYELNGFKTYAAANQFYKTGASATFTINQDRKARSIASPWLASYTAHYEDAAGINNKGASSYRFMQGARIQTPGVLNNDGLAFTYAEQNQVDNMSTYRFRPGGNALSYVFSRGYSYRDTPRFQKVSGEYYVPLFYPDWNVWRLLYLKRIYSNFFFDSTTVEELGQKETLNSYGAEALFDVTLLRLLPLSIGGRVYQRLKDNKVEGEVFIATDLGF